MGDGLSADGAGGRNLAKVGIRHCLKQRRSLGELGGGELVEVGVGNADVDDVRSDVCDLGRQVVGDCTLHGEVPLLDVSGPCLSIGGVDALAETRVGRERNGRDGRTWERDEGGRRLSCVFCCTFWMNGNCGVVNGVVMPD